jgi:hypothetical protein
MRMLKVVRQHAIARLVAATLSLALMFASIVGTAAHARHHAHHHHQQGSAAHAHAYVHGDHDHGDSDGSAVAADEPESVGASAGGTVPKPEPASEHRDCMDFACHGGIAILAVGTGWQVAWWPQAPAVVWRSDFVASVSPARLDRPPKSFASA